MEENGTPTESMAAKKSTHKKGLLTILAFTVVVLLLLAGYLGYLVQQKNNLISDKDTEIEKLISGLAGGSDATKEEVLDETKDDSRQDWPTKTAVVFTPEGLFDEGEKTEITNKLINPYVDFMKDLGSEPPASIHVQHNVVNSDDPEYSVDIIYVSGGYEGFLYGNNTKTTQPWYQPVCYEGCEFSDEYKAKYPDVVAAATQEKE